MRFAVLVTLYVAAALAFVQVLPALLMAVLSAAFLFGVSANLLFMP